MRDQVSVSLVQACLGLSGKNEVTVLVNWLLFIASQHPSADLEGRWGQPQEWKNECKLPSWWRVPHLALCLHELIFLLLGTHRGWVLLLHLLRRVRGVAEGSQASCLRRPESSGWHSRGRALSSPLRVLCQGSGGCVTVPRSVCLKGQCVGTSFTARETRTMQMPPPLGALQGEPAFSGREGDPGEMADFPWSHSVARKLV